MSRAKKHFKAGVQLSRRARTRPPAYTKMIPRNSKELLRGTSLSQKILGQHRYWALKIERDAARKSARTRRYLQEVLDMTSGGSAWLLATSALLRGLVRVTIASIPRCTVIDKVFRTLGSRVTGT